MSDEELFYTILLIILCCLIAILLYNWLSRDNTTGFNNLEAILGGLDDVIGKHDNTVGKHDKPGWDEFEVTDTKRLFIPDKATLVVDGHNMIHDLAHRDLSEETFDKYLRNISKMMYSAFPTQDIHIVIKNQQDREIKATDATKATKTKKKKPSVKALPVYDKLIQISKIYPSIKYHLAYDGTNITSNHLDKARDDFLTIMLAKNSYMISQDRFRDFKHFKGVKPFFHYAIENGKVKLVEEINPLYQYDLLDPPTRGNHYIYELVTEETMKKNKITNGSIYLTNDSVFGKIYICKK